MATNFNNKYLQVLQNYDEFGEYSADYTKGEDHVAFLIEENEVIYWLYLEQVWRPLNVRTTKTGELEDGRTKVAVRLEYVEGGQKYTSVPNIPDPERITSMSHFLEDYPDIEEVNVSGTVNLTDLSYAFAGSKIKDFSMLDTGNVDDMTYCLSNIDNNELEVITYSNVTCCISHILDNSTIKSFTYNGTVTDDSYFNNVTAEKLIVNTEQEITELNRALMRISNGCDISYIKGLNIQLSEAYGVNTLELVEAKEISYDYNGSSYNNFKVKCDSFDLYPRKNNINICNQIDVTEVTILNIFNTAQAKFGKGIKYLDTVNFNIKHNNLNNYIGNFIFTTPIVDDAFYAKYAQYNTSISIFQYKTTFEEVADVNISNEVDSNLLYINWDDINFDTTNMNIEINNNIDVKIYTNHHYKTFKLNSNNKILSVYDDSFENLIADNLEITGEYILDRRIYYKNGMHDVIFHDNVLNIKDNVLVEKNIKADDINIIISNDGSDKQFDIDTLIENNIVNSIILIESSTYNDDLHKEEFPIINYNSIINTIYILGNAIALLWYNYITKPNILHIKGEYDYGYAQINLFYKTYEKNTNIYGYEDINNIYLYFESNTYGLMPFRIYENGNNKAYESFFNIQYIHGIINIYLDEHKNNAELKNINYIHIDIEKVFPDDDSVTIIPYMNCDAETNINLITKLIDNTSSSSKTIYMYRSQANIIGEENIAAAVAKNYEIAIIEN